jgi:SAM-dependent methyltransferase
VSSSGGDRERLGGTFDRASDLYQRARPEYPSALFERLLEVTQLRPGARLLEVGCATGKATLPLARRGFRIMCVEPGPALAAAARRNLGGFDVVVLNERFEDWSGLGAPFDMVFAATAWGWVDPEVRYRKAAEALRGDGYLAFWSAGHVIPVDGDPFFVEIQEVYDEIGEGLPPDTPLPRPGELDDQRDEIEASGLFEVAARPALDQINTSFAVLDAVKQTNDVVGTEEACSRLFDLIPGVADRILNSPDTQTNDLLRNMFGEYQAAAGVCKGGDFKGEATYITKGNDYSHQFTSRVQMFPGYLPPTNGRGR